ncbi:MAG: SDR family NAD(P)-dependent oxidoreductase [Burkholderiales bacterium]
MDGVKRSVVIVGAGDATGGAIAKRFAREGFAVVVVRRQADKLVPLCEAIRADGGEVHGFGVDARIEENVVDLFDRVERDIASVELAVFNIGGNVSFKLAETTSRVYFKVWQMACLAGFLTGREAARRMVPRGRGKLFFTGATASLRGGSGFSAFAGAKHGLRAIAQSMARELGPQGIHVAHVVVDGPIDTEFTRARPDLLTGREYPDSIVRPDDVAHAYLDLFRQPRSSWTHELDLRPWGEKW